LEFIASKAQKMVNAQKKARDILSTEKDQDEKGDQE
jgi:hypothetical protein